jgi:hypothetical protein
MYKFKGQLIEKSEIQNVGKTTKLEFVIKDSSTQWENYAKFDIYGDHIQKLKYVNLNEEIEVVFNVKGRQYNGKVYTNLVAYNINTDYNKKVESNQVTDNNSNNDNLPF